MTNKAIPVFIDTDMDFDDYLAIIFLLADPDVDVKGISVTGCGAVYLQNGVKYLTGLLKLLNREDIPIFYGATAPLSYSNQFPYSIRKGANSAYGLTKLLDSEIKPVAGCAIAGLGDILKNSSEKVNIVLLGGATMLAQYIKGHCLDNIDRIVFSGGNITPEQLSGKDKIYGRHGNIQESFIATDDVIYRNSVAEYNVFIDIYATQLLLEAGIDISFITLSATGNGLKNSSALVEKLKNIDTMSAYISRIILQDERSIPIFDLTTAVATIYSYAITKCLRKNIYIEQRFVPDGNDLSGNFVVDEHKGHACDLVMGVSGAATEQCFLQAVSCCTKDI